VFQISLWKRRICMKKKWKKGLALWVAVLCLILGLLPGIPGLSLTPVYAVSPGNVALNKPVTASSIYTVEYDGTLYSSPAENAVDDDLLSSWVTADSQIPISTENPAWLKIDLQDSYVVSRWVVVALAYDGNDDGKADDTYGDYNGCIDCILEGSDDGTDFTPVDSSIDNIDFDQVTGTLTIDKTLATPVTYRYFRLKITKVDQTGFAANINDFRLYGVPVPPPAPAGLSAAAGNAQVSLSWDNVTIATSYKIYQGTSPGAYDSNPAAAVSGTSHTITGLANGTTYYFAVKSNDGVQDSAAYSNEVSATPAAPVTDLAATAGNGQVSFTFSPPTGAAWVVLEQSTDGGATWSPANTGLLNASSSSAVAAGLANGTTYQFRLNVLGGAQNGLSNVVTASPSFFIFDAASGTITGYDPAGGNDVSIPPTIGGVPVTAIGANAFLQLDTITSVVVPDGVISIGDSAFSECYSLSSVSLPNGLTSIGSGAFSACISLSSVTLPNGLTSIGSYAFAYSNNLSGNITIPASVTSIGEGAFEDCWYITGIAIPEGITGIAPRTFYQCAYLSSVTLPSTLTSIGNNAFSSCNRLGSITIPDSVTSIGSSAFSYCIGLSSLSLPDGLETIGDGAFAGCVGLNSITIPDSVTSIGVNAFGACSNLVSITLPAGITGIADFTFDACNRLNGITIPASVTSIGGAAFRNSGLSSITIPAGVTSIGTAAFQECSYLTSVTIPASVTYIGLAAFYNCSQLTGVYFLGDAPEIEYCPPESNLDIFAFTPDSCKVYYPYGASGWTNPWHGRTTIARCTVTYDSSGGSAIADAIVNAGGLLTQPAAPTKESTPFAGWYREASLETPWNFTSDTVTQNITLYAKWNTAPNRKAGIPATTTASVTVNTAYTLNLATIFEDADADPLTYKVSVNGAADIVANVNYSFTPSSAGTTTLVFKANDGTADSADTYTVTLAAANAYTVTGGELGTDYTYAGSTLTFLRPGSFGVSMQSGVTSTTIEKIVVNAPGSSAANPVNITLNAVDVRLSSGFPFDIQGSSHVNLTLTGANVLTTSGDYCAGLHVPVDAALTIGGAGSLSAAGGMYGAGIGGGSYGSGGTVTISSGTVHATGGSGGAGIGGGAYSGNSGTVTISGGSVTAMGGRNAAGIGGGVDGNGSTVLISGGTVTATGGNFGAGIGGGRGYDNGCGNGGTVTISGGTVTATGGTYGAGIGGGSYGSGGTVTMTGGVTFAEGKDDGKDIGAGYSGSGGSLNLSGTAALFLRSDNSVVPVTTTHTHSSYTGHDGSSIYGIPVAWTGSFGTYLRIYTLSYDINSGSGTVTASSTQLYNTTATVSNGSGLSRVNYTFAGWNTAANGGGTAYAAGSMFTFSADTVLYAQWTATPFTLSYDLDGGAVSPANPTSYTIESDAITLNNPTKTSYTFTGWSGTDITGTLMSVVIPKGSTGNRSYTAHWAATTYTITYDLDGGTVSPANPASYTIESDAITLNNPAKSGYTFTGWSGTGITGTSMSVTIPQGSTDNRSYVAHWTAVSITGTITGTVTEGTNPVSGADVSLTVSGSVYSATTAANGSYSILNVPAGTGYTVTASKSGYTSGSTTNVSVTANATTSGVNITLTAIPPAETTGTISGTVTDGINPVSGADVSLTVSGSVYSATTAANGSYSILNVPAGTGYTVTAAKSGYTSGSTTNVSVTANATTSGVNITLTVIPPADTTGTISGTVTDGINPVSGADLSLTVSGSVYSATTIANGGYSILNVPAGTGYTVTASKSGYTSGSATNVSVTANTTTAGVNITLTAIPPVANTGAISGTVTDGTNPVSGANVRLTVSESVYSDTTAANGSYSITNVPAGTGYTVTASKSGYTSGSATNVSVAANATTSGVNITLIAIPPADTTGTISGTVTDGINPVSGADVSLTVSESVYSATTIADGSYSILNVPAGTGYTVTASKAGYTDANATNVSVTANTTTSGVNITLTAISPVTHTVSVSANPAAGGTVTGGGTYNEGASVTVTATANSGYTFVNWTEGGSPVSTEAAYTFTLGTSDRTLAAKFTATSGGGGGSTPTTPATPSTPVTTVPSADGKTTTATAEVKPTVNETTGTATATVSASVVTDLAAQAKAAEASGQKAVVEIKVETAPAAKEIAVEIPRDAFNKVATDTKAEVTISTGLGSITFSEKAVDSISGAAGTGAVSISIAKVEASALSPQVQAKVGDRPVYDFSVKAGSTEISRFGGGSAEISIPYTPKAGEKKNAIVVYYIDNQGKLQTVRGKYDAATGTVSFKTTHFSQYAVGYNEVSFKDVSADAWYNEAVGFIAARSITTGTGNGNYSPEAKLTRGEFIVMVMKAYGIEPDADLTNNFSDAGNTYYTGYLAAAKRLAISGGIGNNMFAPGKEITRQEMFTLLYNALKAIGELPEGTSGKSLSDFRDTDMIAAWARDAMTLFVETGTIGGSGGKLTPTDTTTRAQMAQVLYNLSAK
jgi:uncharacterized repeat protein (TIGR02543 family)